MPDPISWAYVWHWYLLALAAGYLAGSLPTGYLLTRLAGLGDVRQTGSSNIGATNVLRRAGRLLSALTLAGDAAKGAAAAGAANYFFGLDIAVIAAAGALLGHNFPVWLGFRGGKGAATYGGVLAALYLPLACLYALLWAGLLLLSRRASLASLLTSLATPPLAWWLHEWQLAEACLFFSALIFFTHRENIVRLAKGVEPVTGHSKSTHPPESSS